MNEKTYTGQERRSPPGNLAQIEIMRLKDENKRLGAALRLVQGECGILMGKVSAWEAARAAPSMPADTAAMADCMDQVHADLVKMGIINKSVAPMFIPEAVAAYVRKSQPSAPEAPIDRGSVLEEAANEIAPDHCTSSTLRGAATAIRALKSAPAPLAVALPADQGAPAGCVVGRVRALAEKWNKDSIANGFAGSLPAYELLDVLDAAPTVATPTALPAGPSEQLRAALQKIIDCVPAHNSECNGFFVEHRGPDGEYLGSQQINPDDIIQEMQSIAANALASAAPADQPAGSGVAK